MPDVWIAMDATKIGYEISFGRYIYKPTRCVPSNKFALTS
jgi:type I restriction enzyme M protein